MIDVEQEAFRLRRAANATSASDWALSLGLPEVCWVTHHVAYRQIDGMAFVDVERPGGYMVQPRSAAYMFCAQVVLLCERLDPPPVEMAALASRILAGGQVTIWRL